MRRSVPEGRNHMRKKRAAKSEIIPLAGYVPASYTPTIDQQQIKQIPPYEDTGVRYEGYSKQKKNAEEYLLKKQTTRYASILANNSSPSQDNKVTRADNATKNFFCTGLFLQATASGISPSYIQVCDVINGVSNVRFNWYYMSPTYREDGIYFDFSALPRPFLGDQINIKVQTALGAGDYVHVELFGFDEEK